MSTNLNPAGWTRLVIYVISALVGVAAVVATTLGYTEVSGLLGTLAAAGAAITGGTAVANLPKAPDQTSATGGLDLQKIIPALHEISQAAQVYKQAMQYEGRHADAPTPVDVLPAVELPTYGGPTTREA